EPILSASAEEPRPLPDVEKLPFGDARFSGRPTSAAFKKSAGGTSQFVDWAACAVLNRSKMVLSGDVPSNCSLASFRHARFFDFFNEIRHNRKQLTAIRSFR